MPPPATPTICVAIVNYNYARYLPQAIDSVLDQLDPFDQVIIVDDGSTDNSREVIAAYDGLVEPILKENGGQLTASLAALARCRCDYFYVLDADDYVAAEFVATLRPHLGEAVKVQCQLIGVDGEGEPLGSIFPTYPPNYDAARMRQDNRTIGFYICPPTAGNVYRRSYLEGLKLSLLQPNEPLDGPPALAAPEVGEVVTVPRPLAYYRVHGSNESRWDKPDADLLQREVRWLSQRWHNVCEMVGRALHPPPEPLYVIERRIMYGALEGKAVIGPALQFLAKLRFTNHAPRQKLLLAAWAALMFVPLGGWRRRLVMARRSPVNRPKIANGLLLRLLRRRA